jgi:cyclase
LPKIRVIPSILTDGMSQVKGEKFDNWRTVGSVQTAIQLFQSRDVDEIVLLDVRATSEQRFLDLELVRAIAGVLRVPLAVGGGITSVEQISDLLRAGADRVVIGSAWYTQPELISEAAAIFGSQAIICTLDCSESNRLARVAWGTTDSAVSAASRLETLGAGELLLQNTSRDGVMEGMDLASIEAVSSTVGVPVIAGSGAGTPQHALEALQAGASAVAIGAMFQFTPVTPGQVKEHVANHGLEVRL